MQLEFIFDIFCDFDYEMTILQFEEFCKLLNTDVLTTQTLEKDEFVELLLNEKGNFDILKQAKYLFIATMGIKSDGSHYE